MYTMRPIERDDLEPLALLCDGFGMRHDRGLDMQDEGRGIYLTAWEGDEPVGQLWLRWGSTEIPRISDRFPHVARWRDDPEFCNIFVKPKRRSRGIGTAMMQRALDLSRDRGHAHVTLTVDEDNPRARVLYERFGFREVGIGVFTTSGTCENDEGETIPWQNGPQFLLHRAVD